MQNPSRLVHLCADVQMHLGLREFVIADEPMKMSLNSVVIREQRIIVRSFSTGAFVTDAGNAIRSYGIREVSCASQS